LPAAKTLQAGPRRKRTARVQGMVQNMVIRRKVDATPRRVNPSSRIREVGLNTEN